MARVKKTLGYLRTLRKKDYKGYSCLLNLYNRWKKDIDIEVFSDFLDIIWKEIDNIRPKLGVNTYNNFRGTALEEFCFDLLKKIIKETEVENVIELFWNQKILAEEFYIFENGRFKKYPKHKTVDIVVGKREDSLIHPIIIISCKIWQSTNWLDEDRAVLDNIRNRYPNVLGYSLCMSLQAPAVSLISSQRTGLRVFDLSKDGKLNEFIVDIKEVLTEVKKSAR
jgi:hypothetical protein